MLHSLMCVYSGQYSNNDYEHQINLYCIMKQQAGAEQAMYNYNIKSLELIFSKVSYM